MRVGVAAGVLLTAAAAFAQEPEIEEIVVTGSRIPRLDFESASPVVTVPAERFEQRASATVEATLNTIPQFTGYAGATTNYETAQGQAQLSLRGLNPSATLVLIDGRRIVPANGYGVPDVNLIPPALVERVEVLTGGASAVYGSDAEAGVVNFHLLNTYHGLEFSGDYGVAGQGDGTTYTAGITGGLTFADGRGSLMGYVGYSSRDQVTQAARRYSAVWLDYYGPGTNGVGPGGAYLPGGSTSIEQGRANLQPSQDAFDTLFAIYGYPAGTVPYQTAFGFNADGTLFTRGNKEPDSVANFRGYKDPLSFNNRNYIYNFARSLNMQLPLERTSGFVSGGFKFNEAAELYAQGLVGDYSVHNQLAPAPMPAVTVPVTNPYIPADLKFLLDSRTNPEAPFRFAKRTSETGPRDFENNYGTWQATLGFRGSLGSDWRYDAYAQYGRSDQSVVLAGAVNIDRFQELIDAPDGGKAICGGMNPFGLDSISPKCASYFAVRTVNDEAIQELTSEFSINGPLANLPAGPLTASFGVFYKDDKYSLRADDRLDDGNIIGSTYGGQGDVTGADHNLDFYVEALVPLLGDLPGARSLRTVLGYRYSDYASSGGTSSYKAELLYEPVEPVRFRGSYQHAVRSPSVFELYEPQLATGFTLLEDDPCTVGSTYRTGPNGTKVEALCIAQGIPTDLMPYFTETSVEGVQGGNSDLTPETAKTWTVGVVLKSPFRGSLLENLQASIDWYDIRITNAIVRYPAMWFVPHCYDPQYNPNLDVSNRYCGYFKRDQATGVIVDAYEINRNIGGMETSGIDFEIDWHAPVGPGQLGVAWLLTWLDTWSYHDDPQSKPTEWIDTGCCPTLPRWKWNLGTSFGVAQVTVHAIWQFLGAFESWDHPSDKVSATSYVDLVAAYEFDVGDLNGLSVRFGITNLFNQEPPIFAGHGPANTDPAVFDVIGRRYFVGVNYAVRPGAR